MTTAPNKRYRPTLDERSAGILTSEEYRAALQWADWWKNGIIGVFVVLVAQFCFLVYVVLAHISTETGLIRPVTPALQTQINKLHNGTGLTLSSTAKIRPVGWLGKLPNALMECNKKTPCQTALNEYAAWTTRNTDAKKALQNVEKTGGAFIVVFLFGMFAIQEARNWPAWESREQAALTRRKLKVRRK